MAACGSGSRILLTSPLSGVLVPLADVPDPVFAEKMLGDGIAIAPVSSVLCAPCDGIVTQLHSAGHAVTVTPVPGVDILMHIGLDTVTLKGQGFTPQVATGDCVKQGQPLIAFDPAVIEGKALNPLTMMIVSSGKAVIAQSAAGEAEAGVTTVLELQLEGATEGAAVSSSTTAPSLTGETVISDTLTVSNASGIHARPAAVLAAQAKLYASTIMIRKNGTDVNAKSVVAILGMDIGNGDSISFAASGTDAREAVDALAALVRSGCGENAHEQANGEATPAPSARVTDDPNLFLGVSASPGLAHGVIHHLARETFSFSETGTDADAENTSLRNALRAACTELDAVQQGLRLKADSERAAIFAAHKEILEDPELLDTAYRAVDSGKSAAFAWNTAFTAQADTLARLSNELLAARANDIRDAGTRVLRHILGHDATPCPFPAGAIIVAEDLTPSQTAAFDPASIRGICTVGGSATSHVAILARSMGIPAVVAVPQTILTAPEGATAVLDGDNGSLRMHPDEHEIARATQAQRDAATRRDRHRAAAMEPAVTRDGCRIKVVGNIGNTAEAQDVVANGGEGVGLLRSEFLFLHRPDAPGEEEQAEAYAAIARTLGKDRDLVIRTLDVGGDKPLPYMPMPHEENPFLGVRGVRLFLGNGANGALLASQIRAILSAAPHSKLHIMFPMVSSVEELREAKAIVAREQASLGVTAPVHVGIMVEVPSTAILADNLASEADFFSIGTNDLTQYTLAMDRGNPRLAALADGLHPAVLRLIAMTVEGAHSQGKWVGICGGLAGDLEAVPFLLGLGVDELSVEPARIPAVKARIRELDMEQCRTFAADALAMLTARDVREYGKMLS